MVLFDLRITKFSPTMAPTTRSSRLLSNGNSKEETPLKVVKAKKVPTTRESPLKVCGIKVGASVDTYTKPWTGVNLESSVVAKSKEKRGKKEENPEKEEDLVMDLEDVALPEGFLADFSEMEVMEIPASLLTWYDKNHRVLPWRINTYSRLKSSEKGCKEEGFVVVKKGEKSTPKLKVKFPFFLFLSFYVHETEKFRMNKCVDAKTMDYLDCFGAHLAFLKKTKCCTSHNRK